MATALRNDPIKLHAGVKEEDFERFMLEDLLPFFSKKYAGPTRVTTAFLTSQSLLKDTKGGRKYLWRTVWSGPAESVRGASFDRVLMVDQKPAETEAKLKKLESFGKRTSESVFTEVVR